MSQFRRGDIWTVGGGPGSYTNKPRPSVVIRSDNFDSKEGVTIIPLTTTNSDSPTRVEILPADTSQLTRTSYAMTDKIHTYKRTALGTYCGQLTPEQLVEVERALLLYLGIVR